MTLLLPAQRRAVRQWVFDALAAAGKPIPLERIVPTPQDAVELARPYVILVDTGAVDLGPAPERRATGGHGASTHRSYSVGTGSVSITIVGPVSAESYDDVAGAYTAVIKPYLYDDDVSAPLRAANLSINNVTVLSGLERLTGQSQWETRAALDVTFNRTTVTSTTPGTVAEAEITGTTDPPTPIGTFTVGTV